MDFVFTSLILGFGVLSVYGSKCDDYELPCNDGTCINEASWCDSEGDCPDGSDEKYCKLANIFSRDPNKCPPSFYRCRAGPCIPIVGRCDGHPQCEDKSDEDNCNEFASELTIDTTHVQSTVAVQSTSMSGPVQSDPQQREHLGETTLVRSVGEQTRQRNVYVENDHYSELRTGYYHRQRELAVDWLLSQRKEDFGWGDETPRALTALQLARGYPVSDKDETNMLMVKQFDIQLSIALARNSTQPMALTDLALHINTLLATCRNPKNFYGYDLVNTLRYRVNFAQNDGQFVSPLVYLTLCLNNEIAYLDIRKLMEIYSSRDLNMDRLDIQALTLLALSCVIKLPEYSSNTQVRLGSIQRLLDKVQTEGLPGNVYEVALLTQALNEARVNEKLWNREAAIKFIEERQSQDGSFGDILATYYVLPVLCGRSLMSLDNHCFHSNVSDLTPIEVLKNTKRERIYVTYSLLSGQPVEMFQKLKIKVAEGTNFLDVMRLAQESNPSYRFRFDDRKGNPFVYSIGGIPNDAERGLYWILHTASNGTNGTSSAVETDRLMPFNGNIKTLVPKSGDEMAFWKKPI